MTFDFCNQLLITCKFTSEFEVKNKFEATYYTGGVTLFIY